MRSRLIFLAIIWSCASQQPNPYCSISRYQSVETILMINTTLNVLFDRTNTLVDRQLMVHLFEWKWTDVASECENFLQYYGYGAVQVSPPMEHVTLTVNGDMPWWIRYQPVSYNLESRSGTEAEFKDMVDRCNKVGVRIIVDGVMNHMVGVGQKKGVSGVGSSGSSDFNAYDGVETFPGVPYSSFDFDDSKCHGDIQNSDYQNNAANVRNCRLSGLLDLNQNSTYVQNMLVGYLNKLISYGVAGFRFDASKHMWPADLNTILDKIDNVRSDLFGSNQRPFAAHEVIDRGGEAIKCSEYLNIGRYTNFNFGSAVSAAAKGQSDWKYLSQLGPGYQYGNYEDHDVLNFIDNHDNQRDSNPYVVTYKDGDKYRLAVSYMLAWPYGYPRVMSSYYFTQHDQGPPNSGAGNGFATTSPKFYSDKTCDSSSGWVCEHRWPTIREMAKFRSSVTGTAAAEVFTDYNRLAFARLGKGFFALNAQKGMWGKYFKTTLPAGQYCDQYGGSLDGNSCTGTTITVDNTGVAFLQIAPGTAMAISMASKIGGPVAPAPVPSSYQKTIILLQKNTNIGENLFIRGGTNTQSCSSGPFQQDSDPCAIPMVHNTTVPFVYNEYLTWRQHDYYMDWEGAEEMQGTHDGQNAAGTPLAYSTNDKTAVEYQSANNYGPGYWMVQVLMDCSKTENGWFELKGYLTPELQWEGNINQATCTGSIGGKSPVSSINHVAKCGAKNVFKWNDNSCIVESL